MILFLLFVYSGMCFDNHLNLFKTNSPSAIGGNLRSSILGARKRPEPAAAAVASPSAAAPRTVTPPGGLFRPPQVSRGVANVSTEDHESVDLVCRHGLVKLIAHLS